MENKEKKQYEKPYAELIQFRFQDLIVASGSSGCVNHDKGHGAPCRMPNQNSNSKRSGC